MGKEFLKAYKNVFDSYTINSIWNLITQRKIEGLESPIKIGKESNVFSALTKDNERLALKVYRINSCDFFKMSRYLSMDKRFKPTKRRIQIILLWAKREFINLKKAYECGVSVPRPVAFKNNVLVSEFIGEKFPNPPYAAKLLKDSYKNAEKLYNQIIENVRQLYQKAKLVHGDLSEFNILNYNGKIVLIDLSHAISSESAEAHNLLKRDIEKIIKFFRKKGIKKNLNEVLRYIKEK